MEPARLQTLLQSNEPPDVDERDHVRAALLPIHQHLADLASRITATRAALAGLIEEQEHKKTY